MAADKLFLTISRGEHAANARPMLVSDDPNLIREVGPLIAKALGYDPAAVDRLVSGPRLMDEDAHPEWMLRLWREADRTDPRRRPILEVRNRELVDKFGRGCCNPPAEEPLPDGLEPGGGPWRRPVYLELRPVVVGLYETPRTWSTDNPRVIKDFIAAVLDADLATPAETAVLAAIPAEIDRALALELDDARAVRVVEHARKRSADADAAVRDFEWTAKQIRRDATAARTRHREAQTATVQRPREVLAELGAEAEAAEARVDPAAKRVETAKMEADRARSAVVAANQALKARESVGGD